MKFEGGQNLQNIPEPAKETIKRGRYEFDPHSGEQILNIPPETREMIENNENPDNEASETYTRGYSYIKPKHAVDTFVGDNLSTEIVEVREGGDEEGGRGLYAHKEMAEGERVFTFDTNIRRGEKRSEITALDGYSSHSIVVGADQKNHSHFVYATPDKQSPLRYVNHSCEPNMARTSDDMFTFVALRKIEKGEQLTADYSLLEINPNWKMDGCMCGSPNCRHSIRDISSTPVEYLSQNWDRLFPEMQVSALQYSKDPEIMHLRNELGAEEYVSDTHRPFLNTKFTKKEVEKSDEPIVIKERNALGAKQLAKIFKERFPIKNTSEANSDNLLSEAA